MFKSKINFLSKWVLKKASLVVIAALTFLLLSNYSTAQTKVIEVETFDKIIISPHIEVVFKEGEKESVLIESISLPIEKLNIGVKNKTLHLYLDGAKIASDKKKEYKNGNECKTSVYKGTIVKAVVSYKKINSIDLRGEEVFVFESKINAEKLDLKIYGESQIYMNELDLQDLQVAMFGESELEIKQGKVENQKIVMYGESKVNAMNVDNAETKITAYGEGDFQLNVSGKLKITAYGEASVSYYGNPILHKGIILGEAQITNLEAIE